MAGWLALLGAAAADGFSWFFFPPRMVSFLLFLFFPVPFVLDHLPLGLCFDHLWLVLNTHTHKYKSEKNVRRGGGGGDFLLSVGISSHFPPLKGPAAAGGGKGKCRQ